MTHRPFRIGLTGSIGTGKSTAAAAFRDAGVPVFDADAEVHRMQGPGGSVVAAIEARFPGTTGPGGVDRQALGSIVLKDPDERGALEAIVHPAVRDARRRFIARHRAYAMVLMDIPLLFETGGEREMDLVVLVTSTSFLQRRRVLRRPGMNEARLRRVRAAQMPDHVKRRKADVIIETGQPKWQTRAQIRLLVACLRGALVR